MSKASSESIRIFVLGVGKQALSPHTILLPTLLMNRLSTERIKQRISGTKWQLWRTILRKMPKLLNENVKSEACNTAEIYTYIPTRPCTYPELDIAWLHTYRISLESSVVPWKHWKENERDCEDLKNAQSWSHCLLLHTRGHKEKTPKIGIFPQRHECSMHICFTRELGYYNKL